jgi:RHS repeat-associated protein
MRIDWSRAVSLGARLVACLLVNSQLAIAVTSGTGLGPGSDAGAAASSGESTAGPVVQPNHAIDSGSGSAINSLKSWSSAVGSGFLHRLSATGLNGEAFREASLFGDFAKAAAPMAQSEDATSEATTKTGVVFSPVSAGFGDVGIGSTSHAIVVTAHNYTSSPVSFLGSSGLKEFKVQGGTCPLTVKAKALAAGGTCTFDATFAPTVIEAASGELIFGGAGKRFTFQLSGTGVAATVAFSPAAAIFGDAGVGTTSQPIAVTIHNYSTSPVGYSSSSNLKEFKLVDETCTLIGSAKKELAPGGSCTFTASFAPTAIGASRGEVIFSEGSKHVTFQLTGTGVSANVLFSPAEANFGDVEVGATGRYTVVTVRNYTRSTVRYLSSSGLKNFQLKDGTCPLPGNGKGLAADGTCTFDAAFEPTALGAATGELAFSDGSKDVTFKMIGKGTPGIMANPGGPYTGKAAQPVTFNGSASKAPSGEKLTVYAWSFGDGTTGAGVSPTHTYAKAGGYTVTLTVTDSSGGKAAATTPATIVNPSTAPVANPGGPYTGNVNQIITFNGSGSTAASGLTITSYAWNFGDGTTGTGVSPTHSYITATGSPFTVTLTVTDSSSATGAATTMATIYPPPVANPGGTYTGNVNQAITFNGSGSTSATGDAITSYAWNFGDGTTGTGASPTHTYTTTTGSPFTVTLTVTDTTGGTGTATTTATISNSTKPVANPGGPYTGNVNQAISFNGAGSTASTGLTITSYAWNFGDGTTGTGVSPTHSYTTATGSPFTVTLTVTDSSSATGAATTMATIYPLPVANPDGPYTGNVNQVISFNGSGSTSATGDTITSYAWNFGDGTTGTGASTTHTYTTATGSPFTVSLTVTDTSGGTGTATTTATITALPVASAGGPYIGNPGQTITFNGSGSTAPTGQTLTSYAWNFGDSTTGTGVSPTHSYAKTGTYTVTLTVTDSTNQTATATTIATISPPEAPPTITKFSPTTGTVGTVITVTGTNLVVTGGGSAPQITLAQQGGGVLNAPVANASATSLTFAIPSGAATGAFTVTVGSQSATSSGSLTVTTSSSYTLGVTPAAGTVIQGQSTALAVSITSTTGFSGTAALSVTGVPSGVTASFQPASIAVGQTSVLTLSAPTGQKVATSQLTITGSTTIQGQSVTQSATASIQVTAITTSFLGRTVVDDALQEPVAGVTISFTGKDDKGNATGCSGQTTSDGGGNFSLTNLPTACIGPQLIAYNGMTATAPAGKYAGVNLSYTLVSGQVVASPVLIHLPRIDNAETVQVQQNAANDQVFYFQTIPGLKVTVYAGTTLALDDGSQPNPFPLVGIEIPLDRLPDQIPTTGMLSPFIVAFQPANAMASQPVAVDFPNPLSTPPGSHVTFVTLDPTHGYMVPYGTGTVTSDGSQFRSDPDPTHPGHSYGLVHFDWHGPMPGPPPNVNPSPDGCGGASSGSGGGSGSGGAANPSPGPCLVAGPVDVSSGIVSYSSTDLQISGGRGSIGINRYYRTLASYQGPFGIGTSTDYNYSLSTLAYIDGGSTITIAMPDGNQYVMSQAPNGTFVNATIPSLRGAVLTANGNSGPYNLTWLNGTQFQFTVFTALGRAGAFLTSITDLNGNTTNLTLNPSNPQQIQAITDPVGRSLTLVYDSSNRVTQVTDSIGRVVKYTYNGQGTLATFTDPNGGVTSYTYDSANSLATVTDPREVVTEQNTYNESFDGRVTQQVEADGGVYQFAYTLLNSTLPTSPVLQTVVTDPLGNQTTYRYNTQSFLVSVTDASGQTRTLTRNPSSNNLVSAYSGSGSCPVCGNPGAGNVSYTFDQFGNTLTQTDALGNTTAYTYDTRFNKVNSVQDPIGNTTRFTYDSNGNLTSTTDAKGNTTKIAYNSFGLPIQVTDASGAITALSYDAFGNLTSSTNALGNSSNFIYDAVSRLIQTVDPLGRNSTASYDALNRLVSTSDALGHTIQFTYDPVGSLLSFSDPNGNVTKLTYDPMRRISTRANPLGKTQSYTYDHDSNLTQFTDRRGQVSSFQYDVLNRLVMETYQDSTVSMSYDAAGRLLAVNDSLSGTFGFSYDAAGRPLSQSEPNGTVQYTRDALGRTAALQVAGLSKVAYSYDPVGNLITASNPAAGISYSYDQRNLPTTLTRTNGVSSTFAFDPLGELLSIVHANGPTILNTQKYAYAADGTRTTVSNDIAQALATQSSSGTVNSGSELLTNGSSTYTYDANGNRLTETNGSTVLNYTWDSRNRLTSIADNSGNTTVLHYDFGRNLIEIDKSTPESKTAQKFVFDSLTNVVSFTDASGLPVSVLTGQSLDSHYASVNSSGNVLFGIGDALNGNVAVTNAAGAVSSDLYYEPYGLTTGVPAADFPFGFGGRLAVSGNIYYNRDRYFDSSVGRFLSEDSMGILGGQNPYEYAGDSPVNNNDPTGRGLIGVFVGGVYGAVSGGLAAYAQNGSGSDIFWGAAIGLGLGAVVGLLDPTEGVLTLEAGEAGWGTLAVIGAVAGGAGDAAGQAISIHNQKCPEPFNWGEFWGSVIGGGLGGGLSAGVTVWLQAAPLAAADLAPGFEFLASAAGKEWLTSLVGGLPGLIPSTLGGPIGKSYGAH